MAYVNRNQRNYGECLKVLLAEDSASFKVCIVNKKKIFYGYCKHCLVLKIKRPRDFQLNTSSNNNDLIISELQETFFVTEEHCHGHQLPERSS